MRLYEYTSKAGRTRTYAFLEEREFDWGVKIKLGHLDRDGNVRLGDDGEPQGFWVKPELCKAVAETDGATEAETQKPQREPGDETGHESASDDDLPF